MTNTTLFLTSINFLHVSNVPSENTPAWDRNIFAIQLLWILTTELKDIIRSRYMLLMSIQYIS